MASNDGFVCPVLQNATPSFNTARKPGGICGTQFVADILDMTRVPSLRRTTSTGRALWAVGGGMLPAGFSLVELMIVVGLIAVVSAIAVPVSIGTIARSKANSTTVEARSWLEEARNRATAERRNFEVTFNTSTNRIRVERVEPNATRTLILDRQLSDQMRFMRFEGVSDTPDLFGATADVDFDGPNPHMFTSDGSFIDANGDPSNGSIFIGKSNQPMSARAVTVFGTTGLIRHWEWSGNQWTH
jgi:prepilin-type N-terminal cleavage/methylation domain-containing protein